jgi:hypothetical protein
MEEHLEEPQEPAIMQKEKKPRSPAQIEAFNRARDKRLQLAAQKKIDQAKAIESKIPKKKVVESKPLPSAKEEEEDEPEVVVVKKPKKKKIIYQVESDSEEEVIVKTKKKDLPPAPPKAEPVNLPAKVEKPKPVYVFL